MIWLTAWFLQYPSSLPALYQCTKCVGGHKTSSYFNIYHLTLSISPKPWFFFFLFRPQKNNYFSLTIFHSFICFAYGVREYNAKYLCLALFWKIVFFLFCLPQGHYLYIETSAPRHPGQKACLVSSQVTQTTPQCLKFYYNLHGNNIGALNIYVMIGSALTSTDSPVWSRRNNLSDTWIPGQTTITGSSPYRVNMLHWLSISLTHFII